MVIRTTKNEVASFIFVLLLTIVSNDTFLFGSNNNQIMIAIPRYALLGFAIILGIKMIVENRIAIRYYFVAFVFVFLMAASSIYNHISISLFAIKIATLLAGFLFCQYYSFEKWSLYFRKTMYFLAICSILMTLLAYVSPALIRVLPTATNTAGVKMYLGFMSGILDVTMGSKFIRCPGVFWEPGVYQIYLNVAIMLSLYSSHAKKRKHVIVYLIALFFTFSTTGYIAAAWIFTTYYAFAKKSDRSIVKSIMYFCLLLLAFIAALALRYSQMFSFVFGKLNKTDGSYIARLAGFVINYEIAIDYPIFGYGADMGKMAEEFIIRSSASKVISGWTRHNTNTLMYQFAAFGIPFGLIYLLGICTFGRQLSKNTLVILSIFGAFVIMFTGENLFSSIFPYILVFYGIQSIGHSMRSRSGIDKVMLLGDVWQ